MRAEIASGARSVPPAPFFLRRVRTLEALAPRFDGPMTASCAPHGDLHMRDLMMSDAAAWGIDIFRTVPAPVGRDIAKLLLDHGSLIVPAEGIPECKVIPARVRDAFFAGYDVVGPEDLGAGFLPYVKVLSTWLHVPADPGARTPGQRRTLARRLPIAERAFVFGTGG